MKPKVSLEVAATGREEVLAFLSLDVVHAFYDMMGLGPLLQAGLHRALPLLPTCVRIRSQLQIL